MLASCVLSIPPIINLQHGYLQKKEPAEQWQNPLQLDANKIKTVINCSNYRATWKIMEEGHLLAQQSMMCINPMI